jgi:hypothetical protein
MEEAMRHWTKAIAVAAGSVLGGVAVAVALGKFVWDRSTAEAVKRLLPAPAASDAEVFKRDQLEGLPNPVVRYFEFALTSGQALIRTVRVEQTGRFRTGGFGAPWSSLTAVQHFATHPPGFVWDATIRTAPFLSVRVRDAYIGGAGSMQGKLASLITVVDQKDRPELDAGALHRYLAEAVWFPTALLSSQGITWEAIDDTTARATLRHSGTSASLDFHFGENGAIVRGYTPERYREVEGEYVPTPWACSYRRYAPVDGMMVPMEGEVEWVLPEGRLSYCRVRIQAIEHEPGR